LIVVAFLMTDDDRAPGRELHDSADTSGEPIGAGSSVTRSYASPASTHTSVDVDSADQTVISTSPPLSVNAPLPAFNPRELGRALEGQQLDHVVLEQFVGGGGMGAVFRAWDTSLHRTVAVKVLSTPNASDGDSQRRFQTEARSAARLDHPNIARVHYVGEDRGIRYIVFEYIDGANLRDLVNSNGPLSLGEAVNFALQITNALTHAWERDVVHRDIKPSNILISQDNLAKLVDMGLARLEQLDGAEDETATGVTLGTFDYISPEQARNPREADIRSDIYSLGCTLYFMLTGRAPFADGFALQKLLLHQSEAPPDLQALRPDAPDLLASVLATMLAKRPEERFQNPPELAAALVGCMEALGVSAPPPAALPAYRLSTASSPIWWRRNATWLIPGVLLILSVLVLALTWNHAATSQPFPALQIPETMPDVGEPGTEL
jgi:serine/threonine-protein kinase